MPICNLCKNILTAKHILICFFFMILAYFFILREIFYIYEIYQKDQIFDIFLREMFKKDVFGRILGYLSLIKLKDLA